MTMPRQSLIQQIYHSVPETYRGINKFGEHVIQLHYDETPTFATLEKLSIEVLQGLMKYLTARAKNKTSNLTRH